jgi:chromosome partition protein MukE
MTSDGEGLLAVISDPLFARLDIHLRRGGHLSREGDEELYRFAYDALSHLEQFYGRYDCDIVHAPDGYLYLVPCGETLPARPLSRADMLVGMILAQMWLDPALAKEGRVFDQDRVFADLAQLYADPHELVKLLNPRKTGRGKSQRRKSEKALRQEVVAEVGSALRHLTTLGFLVRIDDGHWRLTAAINRFLGPARATGDMQACIDELIEAGQAVEDDEEEDR